MLDDLHDIEITTYRVDCFLLSDEFKEDEVESGRISYVIRGGKIKEDHDEIVENEKERLLRENDDNYTSWVFTESKYKNLKGYDPHVTVAHFRVRDVY